MAGLYIHIPFCKTICHYCDFYKTANNKNIDLFIEALLQEIKLRKSNISERIETIYFGGGTPSQLSINFIESILIEIDRNFIISEIPEITIEVNPDDCSLEYYNDLLGLKFNRLSIGVQSFNDEILKFLNRRHGKIVGFNSIELALKAGFINISVDLIYGIPGQTVSDFIYDLKLLAGLEIPHLSLYHLGIEDNTYFGKLKKTGRIKEIEDTKSEIFYQKLIEFAMTENYEHYEVSNFAKSGLFSMHNVGYWIGKEYLGFGPSAHSYYNGNRYSNVANVNRYIESLKGGSNISVVDVLSDIDKLNEYILLGLRTKWGINLLELAKLCSGNVYDKILRRLLKFKESNYLRIENNNVILSERGMFVSDFILRDLIIT